MGSIMEIVNKRNYYSYNLQIFLILFSGLLILEVILVESTISTKQTQQSCALMKDISSSSFLTGDIGI